MNKIQYEYDMNYLVAIFCCGVITYFTFKLFELYFFFLKTTSLNDISNELARIRYLIEYTIDNDNVDESEDEDSDMNVESEEESNKEEDKEEEDKEEEDKEEDKEEENEEEENEEEDKEESVKEEEENRI
jgi:hypothetical protein